jgi:hypothetical protein
MKATIRAKEPQHAVDKALKHYKDKGYTVHEHKYLGEGIADDKYGSAASETLVTKPYKEPAKKMKESKDNSPPFDGPYTKDKGTVTDKSGAKHTPMSRARDLARKAMKKQADSLKAPSRLGEESSRKAEIVKSAAKKKKPDSKEDTFQAEPEYDLSVVFQQFRKFLIASGHDIEGEVGELFYDEELEDEWVGQPEAQVQQPKADKFSMDNLPNNGWPFGGLTTTSLAPISVTDLGTMTSHSYSDWAKIGSLPTMAPLTQEQIKSWTLDTKGIQALTSVDIQSWKFDMPGTTGGAKFEFNNTGNDWSPRSKDYQK